MTTTAHPHAAQLIMLGTLIDLYLHNPHLTRNVPFWEIGRDGTARGTIEPTPEVSVPAAVGTWAETLGIRPFVMDVNGHPYAIAETDLDGIRLRISGFLDGHHLQPEPEHHPPRDFNCNLRPLPPGGDAA